MPWMSGPPEAVAEGAFTHGPSKLREKLNPDLNDIIVRKSKKGTVLEAFLASDGKRYPLEKVK